MLNAPDLSGFDLDELLDGLLLLTQRQHRCLNWANRISGADDNPGLSTEIDNLDRDAATAAKAHRLVSELRRFASDEGHARLMALLGRGELAPPAPEKKDAA